MASGRTIVEWFLKNMLHRSETDMIEQSNTVFVVRSK